MRQERLPLTLRKQKKGVTFGRLTFNFNRTLGNLGLNRFYYRTAQLLTRPGLLEKMIFCYIFLFVTLMNCVSSCDENCADKSVFTPSRVVVKNGDPASARCSVCQHACLNQLFGVEKSVGDSKTNGTTISWTVDRMTEWSPSVMCYYNGDNGQCCTTLPVTVYQPPHIMSISFVNHTGPMLNGHQYTLQCTVQDVAPVENLIVIFYRGQTALGQLQSSNTENKPVTEIFTLNITPSKEDDGVQYRCEAELELGPEGPQPSPVVMSQNINATVYYKPQLEGTSHPDPITVTEGNPLQLNCSAVGNPSPSYTWMLPSGRASPSSGSVLTISSVAAEHKGQYTCSVSNNMGNVTVKYNVDVKGLELTSTTLPATSTATATTTKTKTVQVVCFMLLFSALV